MREHETLMESYLIDVLRLHPLSFSSLFLFRFLSLFPSRSISLFPPLSFPSLSLSMIYVTPHHYAVLKNYLTLHRRNCAMCDLKGSSMITRSASVSSVFPSIMDLFRQALLCPSSLPSEILAQCAISSPVLSPSPSLLSTFSLLSRVTHSTGRHHTEQCTEGFNIYRVLVYGPIPPRSLALYPPRLLP